MTEIIEGDCLQKMREMAANSISAIVTDPPYGLHFMGKDWDKFANIPNENRYDLPGVKCSMRACEAGQYDSRRDDEFEAFIRDFGVEALRIVKPGGHILMFGSPRRHHRQMCGLEDAGWVIRDCLIWLYGSGFPKSHNHFGIEGYGTALKPAYEPIIMAMKPCEGTFAQNAEKWGQAGINIDGCRLDTKGDPWGTSTCGFHDSLGRVRKDTSKHTNENLAKGRWPANVLLNEAAAAMLDEGVGFAASRFFYCAKASASERGEGNNHPTVKPLKLMKYLITLVMPPKDGVLLDPFAGSGTTILAAHQLGMRAIGIEKSAEYCEIAKARVAND